MKALLRHSGILLNSYSEIFFLQSRLTGLLLIAVTFMNPHVGIAGLLSILFAYLFSSLIGMEKSFLESGFFTYNALLVGLSVGYIFEINGLTLFLIATAGILSFVFSVMLNNIFSYYLKLPILSLPFVIVSSITWLASQGYGGLYVTGLYVHQQLPALGLPSWIEGFLAALGAILFTPYPSAGLLIATVILLHSRILFLLAVGGYYLGASLSGLLSGQMSHMFSDINHFNYILIAMALGGIYLVPSPKSHVVAAIGVAVSTLLLSAVRLFWANYGIPAFTLPFNLITLAFLYVMSVVGFPLVASVIRRSPEETLDEYLSHTSRFGEACREISLPFSGCWTVWQGFDGQWTHQGSWQHAYDFVIQRNGKTHAGSGQKLEDYYAWRKPVLSPCRGRVVRVIDNLPDNPPGHVDSQNNWGNLIIIETMAGWFVEISHFANQSICVVEGEWVEPGARLGLCGNTGYSAQPHIHIQVQASAQIGAATIPFKLKSYLQKGSYISKGNPLEAAQLEPLFPDRRLEFQMAFPLDSQFLYQVNDDGQKAGELWLKVCMGVSGESYLKSDRGRLYFTNDGHSFYFYRLEGNDPLLALIFSALPRMPLAYRQKMKWQDTLPVAVVSSGWYRHFYDLVRTWLPDMGHGIYQAHWASAGLIKGALTYTGNKADDLIEVVLHPRLGFSAIRVGQHELVLEEVK